MKDLIAYSSERSGDIRTQMGSTHYSYRIIEDALVRLFDRAGYPTKYIAEPQIFKHRATYVGLLGVEPEQVVHIAFRSTENIRPMVGARNICHFAWEFDVMKDHGLVTDSVLSNQVHMLRLMDEIWVGCSYTARVLREYGLTHVHVISAPQVDETLPRRRGFSECLDMLGTIPSLPLVLSGALSQERNAELCDNRLAPVRQHPVLQDRLAGGAGKIFLTVLNAGDLRKNLLNLIEGFQMAVGPDARDLLIIKLIVPNNGDFRSTGLYEQIRPRCNGDMSYDDSRVMFILDYLTGPQMEALFSIADYYLSATHCEGFNLPLVQAMSFGTVPVCTTNTAMADYIDSANAVAIAEKSYFGVIPRMAGDVAGMPYALPVATRFDVARACHTAMGQKPDEYDRMAARAAQTVLQKFGAPTILRTAEARLAALPHPLMSDQGEAAHV